MFDTIDKGSRLGIQDVLYVTVDGVQFLHGHVGWLDAIDEIKELQLVFLGQDVVFYGRQMKLVVLEDAVHEIQGRRMDLIHDIHHGMRVHLNLIQLARARIEKTL